MDCRTRAAARPAASRRPATAMVARHNANHRDALHCEADHLQSLPRQRSCDYDEATSATFGRGWPGSVLASTRTRPASWSLAGSR